MRVALITGGQPRFTPDFIKLMNQLTGFDSADLYFNFWTSDWTSDEISGRDKIEKILLPKYQLAKLKIVDQPPVELPPHLLDHSSEEPNGVRWFYKRRLGQCLSLSMAYDLIDQPYDVVIRFRLDGVLFDNLDISTLDLVNNNLIFPSYPQAGFPHFKICDQFAVGTMEGMKFYCKLGKKFNYYITKTNPNWETDPHGWAVEHMLATHMIENNQPHIIGNFKHTINSQGRSRYTDKHYHHQIVSDPTES